jgi:hypothetical protein
MGSSFHCVEFFSRSPERGCRVSVIPTLRLHQEIRAHAAPPKPKVDKQEYQYHVTFCLVIIGHISFEAKYENSPADAAW